MRQSRKILKMIIAILGTALAASLVAVAILLLNNTSGQSEVTLDNFIYEDVNDNLPPVKILSGMVQYQNEAGEWVDLVTLEQLFRDYGGDVGEALPSETQTQTTPPSTMTSPSPTPSPTPMPTNTQSTTSSPRVTTTPKSTATAKPSATVKPSTMPTPTRTPTPTIKPWTPAPSTAPPTTSVPTNPPATTAGGGDGGNITPPPSDGYGGDVE